MVSQKKIIEMVGAIKTVYSYYAKDTDARLLVDTWSMLLDGYDDGIVEKAFFKCLQVCKQPPTPADVIEQIQSMNRVLEKSDEELWSEYKRALVDTCDQIRRFGYTYVDESGISQGERARQEVDKIFNGLDEKIRAYLGSKGELMRNAQSWGVDEHSFYTWEKPRFIKCMPIMERRKEYSNMMLGCAQDKFMLEGG